MHANSHQVLVAPVCSTSNKTPSDNLSANMSRLHLAHAPADIEMQVAALEMRAATALHRGTGRGVGVEQAREWTRELAQLLPEAWAVVILSRDVPVGDNGGGLVVTRLEREEPVRCVRVEAGAAEGSVRRGGMRRVLEEFGDIMKLSRAGLESGAAAVSTADKKKWWNDRAALDSRLAGLVQQVEQDWFDADGLLVMLLGHSRVASASRHLVLVLDEDLQEFPWEAMPALSDRSVSRMPSPAMLRAALQGAVLERDGSGGAVVRADSSQCFFVVNPSGDLDHTQVRRRVSLLAPWSGKAP